MKSRFNPPEVFAHTQKLFPGTVIRALYLTPKAGRPTPPTSPRR